MSVGDWVAGVTALAALIAAGVAVYKSRAEVSKTDAEAALAPVILVKDVSQLTTTIIGQVMQENTDLRGRVQRSEEEIMKLRERTAILEAENKKKEEALHREREQLTLLRISFEEKLRNVAQKYEQEIKELSGASGAQPSESGSKPRNERLP